MKKCKSCPYHLGMIKCITDPCIQCKLNKMKKNPFPEFHFKKSNKLEDKNDKQK